MTLCSVMDGCVMDGWSPGARVCAVRPRYSTPAHVPDQNTDMQGSNANFDVLLH